MRTLAPGIRVGLNLAVAVVHDAIFMVCRPAAPSDEEWIESLALIEHQAASGPGYLIFTAGGEPTGKQRDELVSLFDRRVVPTAVLTEIAGSPVRGMRFVFHTRARARGSSEVRPALGFLTVPTSWRSLIGTKLDELRRYLGEAP